MRIFYYIGYWNSLDDAERCESDFPDPTHPMLIDPQWLAGEREEIVQYLKSGHSFISYLGYSSCRFKCGIDDSEMGTQDLTDGLWIWPSGLHHYFEMHDVILPDEFIETMRRNNFHVTTKPIRWPDIDLDKLDFSFWKDWYHRRISS